MSVLKWMLFLKILLVYGFSVKSVLFPARTDFAKLFLSPAVWNSLPGTVLQYSQTYH